MTRFCSGAGMITQLESVTLSKRLATCINPTTSHESGNTAKCLRRFYWSPSHPRLNTHRC
jgi:hypothetical protein